MSNFKSLVLVSTLSGVALFSTPAAAYSYFNGNLSGLQYTLTDLDLTDGIAPSISFDLAGATLYTRGSLEGAITDFGTQTTTPGQQISRADLTGLNVFRSAAFFTGQIGNVDSVSTSGAADVLTNGGLADSAGTIHASSSASIDFHIDYTLSAQTGVSFFMTYSLEAIAYSDPADGLRDSATMNASLYAGSYNNDDQKNVAIETVYPASDIGANGGFSVVSNNYTLSSKTGYFAASIRGDAIDYGQAPAVPEPETWAMLLAGLFGVGFVARRRQA